MSTSYDVDDIVSILEDSPIEELEDAYRLFTDGILRDGHCTTDELKFVFAYNRALSRKYLEAGSFEAWALSEYSGRASKIAGIALRDAERGYSNDDTAYCCFCGGRLTKREAACNFGGYYGPAHEGCARGAYRQYEIQMSQNPLSPLSPF